MPRTLKDWNEVLRDYSSGEDSDAGDSLNVMSVQRNAHRVAEMMQSVAGLPTSNGGRPQPPMGMNEANVAEFMRDGLAPAIAAVSLRSRAGAAAAVVARQEGGVGGGSTDPGREGSCGSRAVGGTPP